MADLIGREWAAAAWKGCLLQGNVAMCSASLPPLVVGAPKNILLQRTIEFCSGLLSGRQIASAEHTGQDEPERAFELAMA